jgi:mRNA-degrading endonuclease RelE of RelBE toxin-antitoxin system
VTYVPFMTASGHRILINPKKQKAIFQNFIEGMLAESHFYFNERAISYGEYRSGRGQKNVGGSSVRIVQSVRKQLDKLDDKTFVKLDIGILRLEQQPAPLKSKPKHYRWFLGDLRRVVIGDFPVIYRLNGPGSRLRILYVSLGAWKNPAKQKLPNAGGMHRRALSKKEGHVSATPRNSRPKWTDQFIGYAGETPQELFSYPPNGQYDSLVYGFREALQRKAKRRGFSSLSSAERVVLAVTALEEEVNNGGFDQFFRNASGRFAPMIVDALKRVGCKHEANTTRKALDALRVRKFDEKLLRKTLSVNDPDRDEKLEQAANSSIEHKPECPSGSTRLFEETGEAYFSLIHSTH